jgi:hypothetical protein
VAEGRDPVHDTRSPSEVDASRAFLLRHRDVAMMLGPASEIGLMLPA